jgi:2-polyprenyl-3-methyl-5-hydroxy-6-metoxy-1,4-benzoquinol methylase
VYDQYDTFKGWHNYFQYSEEQNRYFTKEFQGFPLTGKRILEIGYGEGSLLAWMRDQGAHVVGVELNERSLEEATKQGISAFSDLESAFKEKTKPFDLIVAFDVFEHLQVEEINSLLGQAKGNLSANGCLFIRVPNGRSPWGLVNQYGDLTHCTVLSDLRLQQLALNAGYTLKSCRDQAQVTRKRLRKRMLDIVFHFARRTVDFLIRRIYGFGNIPLGSNIVAILAPQKTHDDH